MAQILRKFIKQGWRVVTEIHTAHWIVIDVLWALVPASAVTMAVSWLGEHSIAVLAMAFVITFAAASLILLAYLGHRTERHESTQDGPRQEPTFEPRQNGWMPIADAIQHVSESIGDTNKAECYPDTLAAIRAAAYDKKISIRGRKQLPYRGNFRSRDAYSDLRTDIESAYWQNSVLNAYSTSSAQHLDYHTQPESLMAWGPSGPDERNHYADLVVSELDLFRQWPKG
jgi:hypothetical protein